MRLRRAAQRLTVLGTDARHPRRADWRFLLPTAREERVVDVTDQRLARLFPQSLTDSGLPVDLAVGTNPQSQQLEEAYGALRPGGVCYFEWRSRLRPSSRTLRRRLEAAGFDGVRLYWSWPPETPSVWVPLEAPGAIRWVLRRRHATAVSRAWTAANAAHLVRPCCATAARPPFSEDVGPRGVPLEGRVSTPFWALLAPGSAPLNKVLAFVGGSGRRDPALVLKMPRTPAAVGALEREAAALEAFHAEPSLAGVPKVLFDHRERGTLQAIAESPLDGQPLSRLLERRRHLALMRRSTEWLVQLAQRPAGRATGARNTAGDLAAEAAADATPGDRELILRAGRLAAAADTLPEVFEQRDFSPWNVHIAPDGALVVFDWESAEPAGFPMLDLVYLLAYSGFFLDRALESGRLLDSYRATFASPIANECISQYCRSLAIDPDLLPALRTLTWLVHLRSALQRASSEAGAALFLELLREEVMGAPLADAAQ